MHKFIHTEWDKTGFKEIPGASCYFINQQGEVKNCKGRTILPHKHNLGYLRVGLKREAGRQLKKYVHVLVALTFIENPNNLPQVNHKDGNKKNNCVENLEWVSQSENIIHAIKNGLLVPNFKPMLEHNKLYGTWNKGRHTGNQYTKTKNRELEQGFRVLQASYEL